MFTLKELADRLGGEIRGDGDCRISRIASLDHAGPGDLSFLSNRHYLELLHATRASAVIVSDQDARFCPVTAWVVSHPYVVYARVAQLIHPVAGVSAGIAPGVVMDDSARIDDSACIGANSVIGKRVEIEAQVYIGPGCVIGDDCRVGRGSRLTANVTLLHDVHIGERALIHGGAVIGADGFGFARDRDEWIKIPQVGGVRIGDDVEIGANTTVDRGALDNTIIGTGVKLDNLVQIAHNVRIGEHTAIAGCTAIAGSTTIGKRCAIGGCVGIVGHLTVTDDVQINAKTFVTSSIDKAGTYSSGLPADTNRQWRRNAVRFRQLDDWVRRVAALEDQIDNE